MNVRLHMTSDLINLIESKFISALQHMTNERHNVESRFSQEQKQVCQVSNCVVMTLLSSMKC